MATGKTERHRRKTEYERNIAEAEAKREKSPKNIFKGVIKQISADNLSLISAGVAFYIFLAIFPAIAALLSIYGLVMEPQEVQQQMSQISSILPDQAQPVLTDRLSVIASKSGETLGWGVALSILLGLWSANKGTKALFKGVNIAYNVDDTRNFFRENGISLLFTLIGILLAIISMSLIVGFPALADQLPVPEVMKLVVKWGRWVLLGFLIILFIGAIYKYAPVRDPHGHKGLNIGAVIATILWLLGSWVFSFYINNFGSYDKTYGSVAAVIILMLYFFLTAFIILIGAEINAETEK